MKDTQQSGEIIKVSSPEAWYLIAKPWQGRGNHNVIDTDDEPVGRLEGLYVERVHRKLEEPDMTGDVDAFWPHFLEVSRGSVWPGKKHFLIPIEAIEEATDEHFKLRYPRQKVWNSPEFDDSADLDAKRFKPDFLRALYSYYADT